MCTSCRRKHTAKQPIARVMCLGIRAPRGSAVALCSTSSRQRPASGSRSPCGSVETTGSTACMIRMTRRSTRLFRFGWSEARRSTNLWSCLRLQRCPTLATLCANSASHGTRIYSNVEEVWQEESGEEERSEQSESQTGQETDVAEESEEEEPREESESQTGQEKDAEKVLILLLASTTMDARAWT